MIHNALKVGPLPWRGPTPFITCVIALLFISVTVTALHSFYSHKGFPASRGGSISLPPPDSILKINLLRGKILHCDQEGWQHLLRSRFPEKWSLLFA